MSFGDGKIAESNFNDYHCHPTTTGIFPFLFFPLSEFYLFLMKLSSTQIKDIIFHINIQSFPFCNCLCIKNMLVTLDNFFASLISPTPYSRIYYTNYAFTDCLKIGYFAFLSFYLGFLFHEHPRFTGK